MGEGVWGFYSCDTGLYPIELANQLGAGARFSKVPIINGPGKLSPFTLKIEVSDQFMFLGNRARFLITVPVLLDRTRH